MADVRPEQAGEAQRGGRGVESQRVIENDVVLEDDGTITYNGVPFTGIVCDYDTDGKLWSEAEYVEA